RLFELALFGGLTACLMLSLYLIGRDGIRAGDVSGFITLEKDGLIELLILMIAYGMLIPNKPRRAAAVVLTMSLAPFLAGSVLLASEPAPTPVLEALRTVEHVGQIALFVLIGAGLAICGVHSRGVTPSAVP